MNTSERFLKFAAECEVMAKGAPNRGNRAAWRSIAQRWIRCAELIERQELISSGRRLDAAPRKA